jgi:hypothetical protein
MATNNHNQAAPLLRDDWNSVHTSITSTPRQKTEDTLEHNISTIAVRLWVLWKLCLSLVIGKSYLQNSPCSIADGAFKPSHSPVFIWLSFDTSAARL